MKLLLGLTAYAYYLQALGGIAAPFVAREFALDDRRITGIAAWISLGALGTALLTRLADRHGRRGLLVLSFAGLPPLALASALAPDLFVYTLSQIGVTALYGALMAGIAVAITERSSDAGRASGHAWLGLCASMGGALAITLAAAVDFVPRGWRGFWLVAALPLLAIPFVRAGMSETERFEHARARGRTAAARVADLFRGGYRRRSIGLLAVAALRPIALVATGTWAYYHMVRTLELAPGVGSLVYFAGGGIGLAGNALGARLTNRWGRRPTSALGAAVAVASGIGFYWVPAGPWLVPGLIAAMAVNQMALSAFSVADRLVETELFPTSLRATYVGASRLVSAATVVVAGFALSALAGPLGGLVPAISLLSIVTFVPALWVFLRVTPETRGLTLEIASLEE
jgi:MFS family permease